MSAAPTARVGSTSGLGAALGATGRGLDLRLRLLPGHELPRFALELLHFAQRELHLGFGLLVGHDRKRALRAPLLVRIAAAVEVVLRERVGEDRLRLRLRVDQHDVERRALVVEV